MYKYIEVEDINIYGKMAHRKRQAKMRKALLRQMHQVSGKALKSISVVALIQMATHVAGA